MNTVLDISKHSNWRRKSELIYTEAYFDALRKIVDDRPHRCAGCGVADGSKEGKNGGLRKFPAVVRLCLIDATAAPNDPRNVDMYCTACRKAPLGWRTPRRIKPGQLQQLFIPAQTGPVKPHEGVAA
jgi:hypothetical protein